MILKLPLAVELAVSVDVPVPFTERVRVLALNVAARLGEDDAATSAILPEKPLRLFNVIADVPEVPSRTLIELGLAEMLKSDATVMPPMNVDQQFPPSIPGKQVPALLLMYSPATQTSVGLEGSTAAPK